MEIVKVRRVGTSNVVSLPRAFERLGYRPGTFVVLDDLPNGDIILRRADSVRKAVEAITPRVIEESQEALDLLAAYDRGEENLRPERRSA
ncbi:MAG TPA: hypothetical protein VNL16_16605 [Chloroflexota bacterium]|nr:hypothetical protein [Chloroflexota bacterium]